MDALKRDLEIRAQAHCRSCGKTRELAGDELHGAADMDAVKGLRRRLQCTDCGERAVSVEPKFHPDWAGLRTTLTLDGAFAASNVAMELYGRTRWAATRGHASAGRSKFRSRVSPM